MKQRKLYRATGRDPYTIYCVILVLAALIYGMCSVSGLWRG